MGSKFAASCYFLLYVLLVSQVTHSSSASRESPERSFDDEMPKNHVHDHPSSPMVDPSLKIFFTIHDLKIGKKIPIYFSSKDPSTSPPLLSRQESNSIPFSSSLLPNLLQLFSFPKHSPQAKAMEYTLTQCELQPIQGETKFCATSLESILDSTRGVFGLDTKLKVLTTKLPSKHTAVFQNYTVLEVPKEVYSPKMVACHSMPYPYAVFYCHGQERDHKVFETSLRGDDGERVEAVGVCHMDTSRWNRDHVAFRLLKTRPGESPVCHFFPGDNLVWVAPTMAKS